MYRGTSSPIFDVPEFPTLRRIKPLPKRRRTTSPANEHVGPLEEIPASLEPQNNAHTNSQAYPEQTPRRSTPSPPLDPFVPPGIAEELFSRVDNHSTRMALQNYYLPILGNVQNFLASRGVSATNGDGVSNSATAAAAALAAVAGGGRNGPIPIPPLADIDSIEFGVHFAAAAAAAAAAGLPMGGLGSLGAGLASINMHMGPAGTGVDGKVDTSINVMTPSQLQDGVVLGPTTEYGSSPGGREEEISREDDYAIQVRQPGNAKKRKVPANLIGSPRGVCNAGEDRSPSSSYLDDDGSDSLIGVEAEFRPKEVNLSKERDGDRDYDSTPPPVSPTPPFPGQLSALIRKKGKLTAATLAGLQHKEQLKARKRQLAAVMGALSYGDTLALDRALSFNYPFASSSGQPLKIRKSKRRTVRSTRTMNVLMERPDRKNRHPDAIPFPESEFTFKCSSSTVDHLLTTKEEIGTLRKRFEAELERQAAKLAVAATDGSRPLAKTGRAKRERQERERDRAARAARQKKAKSSINAEDQTPELVDSQNVSLATGIGVEIGGKIKSKTKKKKKAALANASNPHHLRNYVPSRLPHSGPVDGSHVNTNNIWPLPVRFLSAEIPSKVPKSDRRVAASTPVVQFTQPAEEWICAFCEYELFYGDEAAYQKAVRNRKKILRRRRRAAERATAAASGGNTMAKTPPPPTDEGYDECDEATTGGVHEHGNAPPQRDGQCKEAPDKESMANGS